MSTSRSARSLAYPPPAYAALGRAHQLRAEQRAEIRTARRAHRVLRHVRRASGVRPGSRPATRA